MPEHVKTIKIVIVQFNLPIRNEDLPHFRGAVIETTKRNNDLFHNHTRDGVIYRYPRIQYKKIKGKAALVCFEEGTEAIHEFFSNTDWSLRLGEAQHEIRVEEIKARQFNTGVWETRFNYRMTNWLPLNQENYHKYQQTESLSGKTVILEKALLGNLLTFIEGMGIETDKKITAIITRIAREKVLMYHGQLMQSYDLHFSTNVSVPNYASLGKGASIGYGVVMQEMKGKTDKPEE
jgi:hypothetical protein